MQEKMTCDQLQQQYRDLGKLRDAYVSALYQVGTLANLDKRYAGMPDEHPGKQFYDAAAVLRERIRAYKDFLSELFLFPEIYGPQVEAYEEVPETMIEGFGDLERSYDGYRREMFCILQDGGIIVPQGRGIYHWSKEKVGTTAVWQKEKIDESVRYDNAVVALPNGKVVSRQDNKLYSLTRIDGGGWLKEVLCDVCMDSVPIPTDEGVLCSAWSDDGNSKEPILLIADKHTSDWYKHAFHEGQLPPYPKENKIIYSDNGDILSAHFNGADGSINYFTKYGDGEYRDKESMELPTETEDVVLTTKGDILCLHQERNAGLTSKGQGIATLYKKEGVGWEKSPSVSVYVDDSGVAGTFNSSGRISNRNAMVASNDTIVFEKLVSARESYIVFLNQTDDYVWEEGQSFKGHSPKLDKDGNILFVSDGDLKVLRPKTVSK